MLASWWEVVGELGVFGWGTVVVVAWLLVHGTVRVYKIHLMHCERMAMIERGMNPGPFVEKAHDVDEEDEEEDDWPDRKPDRQGETATAAKA